MSPAKKLRRQADSDPLPFVQVDRSVKPKAALLAGEIKVSTQHAMGSLIEWWDLCGDPRELERIVATTPSGQRPAVVLSEEDAALRFRLASGCVVEPMVLARLGLLEEQPGGFRVRGMSRYFEPVVARLKVRNAASVGGKASAAARLEATGTAQPPSGRRSDERSTDGQPEPERLPNGSGTVAEAPPKQDRSLSVSGQRSATVSKEGPSAVASALSLALVEKPKTRPMKKAPDPEAEFARFAATLTPDEGAVFEAYETHMGVRLGADWGLKKFVTGKLEAHRAAELCAAIKGHAGDAWKRQNLPSLRAILRDATVIATSAKAGAA